LIFGDNQHSSNRNLLEQGRKDINSNGKLSGQYPMIAQKPRLQLVVL